MSSQGQRNTQPIEKQRPANAAMPRPLILPTRSIPAVREPVDKEKQEVSSYVLTESQPPSIGVAGVEGGRETEEKRNDQDVRQATQPIEEAS